MYRRNQLKEELDNLRNQNDFLKWQNNHLRELMAQKDLQIKNLQLQLQVKEMSSSFILKPQPVVFNVSSEGQSNFLKGLNYPGQIIIPPEPFETGIKLGVLKEEEDEKENEN